MNGSNGEPLDLLDPEAVDKATVYVGNFRRDKARHSLEVAKALHEVEMALMRLSVAVLENRISQSGERIKSLQGRMKHLSRQDA